MSVLSNPQATPERVFAVVQLLNELNGHAKTQDVILWMQAQTGGEAAVKAAMSVASGLGLISGESEVSLTDDCPRDWETYADFTHAALARANAAEADSELFEVLAWIVSLDVVRLEHTFVGCTAIQCAGYISDGLRKPGSSDHARLFNPTKLVAWVRWMNFLGLGYDGGDGCHFVPVMADRLARELLALIPADQSSVRLPVRDILGALQTRMPYLDGGSVFVRVSGMEPHEAFDQFSYVTSLAWVELERRKALELVAVGDSIGQIRLADGIRDVSRVKVVNEVVVKRTEA